MYKEFNISIEEECGNFFLMDGSVKVASYTSYSDAYKAVCAMKKYHDSRPEAIAHKRELIRQYERGYEASREDAYNNANGHRMGL